MKTAIGCLAVIGLLAGTTYAGDTSRSIPAVTEGSIVSRTPALPVAASAPAQLLFIIERNTNANIVKYDAHLTAGGKLDPKEPVVGYWVMLAEDGHREEFDWIAKKGYGFDIKADPSVNGYRMTMVAVPERPITVKKDGEAAARAELVIDGRPAVLEKMYIDATSGLSWPKVNYVELHGKDLETGEKRFEKLLPK